MKRIGLIAGSAVALGFVGLALAASAGSDGNLSATKESAPNPVLVYAAPLRRTPVAHPIRVAGVIRSKNQYDLGFLIGGEVTFVAVDVGSRVRRGQILARIDQAQVAADAARAHAATLQARRELERVDMLEKSGALPKSALDSAETGHTMAAATLRSADFALRHSSLFAPDDGVIDARLVEPGEMVAAGQPALRLSGYGRGAVVQVQVTDRDVLGLELGRVAQVTLDADSDNRLTAHVSQIAPAASPNSGTFAVELRVDTPPRDFKSGMTAKVEIERVATVGSVVPIAAIVPGDVEGSVVVTLREGIAQRVPVHVLFFESTDAALREPLAGVTEVATEGASRVRTDTQVKVVRP